MKKLLKWPHSEIQPLSSSPRNAAHVCTKAVISPRKQQFWSPVLWCSAEISPLLAHNQWICHGICDLAQVGFTSSWMWFTSGSGFTPRFLPSKALCQQQHRLNFSTSVSKSTASALGMCLGLIQQTPRRHKWGQAPPLPPLLHFAHVVGSSGPAWPLLTAVGTALCPDVSTSWCELCSPIDIGLSGGWCCSQQHRLRDLQNSHHATQCWGAKHFQNAT